MTTHVTIPVPSTVTAGSAVPCSGLLSAGRQYIFAKGDGTCKIEVQIAHEDVDASFVTVDALKFNLSDERNYDNAALWVRANRTKGSGGTHSLVLCGDAAPSTEAVSFNRHAYVQPAGPDSQALLLATASLLTTAITYDQDDFEAAGLTELAANPRQLTIEVSGSTPGDAPTSATVTGRDVAGNVLSEVLAVPQTATTVESVNCYYGNELSVAFSNDGAGTGANISVGFTAYLGLRSMPDVFEGTVVVISERVDGVRATNGTFYTPTEIGPFGAYSSATTPDGAHSYLIHTEAP